MKLCWQNNYLNAGGKWGAMKKFYSSSSQIERSTNKENNSQAVFLAGQSFASA